MSQVRITVRPNGSLRIDDPNSLVELVDAEGNKYDLTGKTAFSLCRCGASANRPFCDGSHKTINFQANDLAPKAAQPPSV
ncbi:MAG TPA: CDGSH iron-sulfur domain-containing protein [Terriglobales bacterium]|nr:CDGSH iron-sulfur domain-containing protein [Terriglobales bacterium]